ncbi:MAG: tetratricopeptide repeat protein [Alphaproteobacteria bacterium]|nr:tetratricopeptide repeat protein [Alphaproteobacteria bacterium]
MTTAINQLVAEAQQLQQAGRLVDAGQRWNDAIALDPTAVEAWFGRGVDHLALGRTREALADFDRAIALAPRAVAAHINRASVLMAMVRPLEALASLDAAIQINPGPAVAHNNRGNALQQLGRYGEAVTSYTKAIKRDPSLADAHYNLGLALDELGRADEALDAYDRAMGLRPDMARLHGQWLMARLRQAQWEGYDQHVARIAEKVDRGIATAMPFQVLAFSDDPALQRKAAECWLADATLPAVPTDALRRRPSGGKLRIGYFSTDFFDHVVGRMVIDQIESHDRSRFEILGFAYGPSVNDAMAARFTRAFDRLIDLRAVSDAEAVQLARDADIDIAVDLNGHTKHHRPGIFALRAAPIQIGYLGYTGTSGSSFIDYIVADRVVITPRSRASFTERVVAMPHCYFPATGKDRGIATETPSRRTLGLP